MDPDPQSCWIRIQFGSGSGFHSILLMFSSSMPSPWTYFWSSLVWCWPLAAAPPCPSCASCSGIRCRYSNVPIMCIMFGDTLQVHSIPIMCIMFGDTLQVHYTLHSIPIMCIMFGDTLQVQQHTHHVHHVRGYATGTATSFLNSKGCSFAKNRSNRCTTKLLLNILALNENLLRFLWQYLSLFIVLNGSTNTKYIWTFMHKLVFKNFKASKKLRNNILLYYK